MMRLFLIKKSDIRRFGIVMCPGEGKLVGKKKRS
jgi:hypothetical protein